MRDADNVKAVEALDVDLMGFIFWADSPRNARGKISYLPGRQKRVGVFVDEMPQTMFAFAVDCKLDYLQFHGHETPTLCENLRASLVDQRPGIQIIKAFHIAKADDLRATEPYEGKADLFLFDTPCPSVGGSGQQFDWSLLSQYAGDTPFLLSGGIGPDSVEAVRHFNHPKCVGIDLNSRFETAPGMKDAALLDTFIKNIKNK